MNAVEIFAALGEKLREFGSDAPSRRAIEEAVAANPWFTPEDIVYAVEAIRTRMLGRGQLEEFAARYPCPVARPRNVGVIMAGNIPLVGFYDLLCTLVAGHACLIKTSSKDNVLMEYVCGLLRGIEPGIAITLLDTLPQPGAPSPFDAVIATGSDNTCRYFRSLYPTIPSLLRGSRHSAAILRGDENARQLSGLAQDMFLYGGLGCRSVGRIFVPEDYQLPPLCAALAQYEQRANPKLRSNCRQRRAVLTMNGVELLDGGFFVMREGDDFPVSPGEIIVTRYADFTHLLHLFEKADTKLQCIVADGFPHRACVPFGMAQRPGLMDFPDGVDVLSFLSKL